MSIIEIAHEPGAAGHAKVAPPDFLGPDLFRRFREACQAAGASFAPALKANLIRLEHLPGLIRKLEGAGFQLKIDPAVRVAAASRAGRSKRSRGC